MATLGRSGIRNFSVALPRATASQFPAASSSKPSSDFSSTAAQVAPPEVDDDERELVTSPQVDANQQRRKLVAPSSHESPSFMHDPIAM